MLRQKAAALALIRRRGLQPMTTAFTAPMSGSGNLTKPSGVEVGDLVFCWALDIASGAGLATSGGSAWSSQTVSIAAGSANGSGKLFWKFLNATDVANAWALDSAADDGVIAVRYRANGATTVTVKDTESNGSGTTTLALAGFAKAAGHRAAIAFFGAPSSTGAGGIVLPSGFTERRKESGAGIAGTYVGIIADTLGSYTDGAAVSFTNCDANATEYGVLVEVTGT
jgi:hypothetical protein